MARKIEFDQELTLKKSMELFWEKGYENTSMQDLVDTLQINRFSIYNSFGDKKSLFQKSLAFYRAHVFDKMNAPLHNSQRSAKQRLDDYLVVFGKNIDKKVGGLGCLVQSTSLSEIAKDKDINSDLTDIFSDLTSALDSAFLDAKKEGDLRTESDPQVCAQHLLCSLQGLIVLRKSLNDPLLASRQIAFIRQNLAYW